MSKKFFYYGSTASYDNQMLTFDGVDEYLTAGAVGVAGNFASAFSITGYFNAASLAGGEKVIIQNGANIINRFLMRVIHQTTGAIEFKLAKVGVANFAWIGTTATYGTGTWRHFGVTYDGSGTTGGMAIYINGAAVATSVLGSAAPAAPISADALYIASVAGASNFYNGSLDEIAMWTVQLSAAEVNEDYNAGCRYDKNTHSQAANLRQWWKVEGSTYPTINGDGVGSTNATMVNMEAGDITSVSPCY